MLNQSLLHTQKCHITVTKPPLCTYFFVFTQNNIIIVLPHGAVTAIPHPIIKVVS